MDNIVTITNEEIAHKELNTEVELRAGRINPINYQTIIDACAKHGTIIQATNGDGDGDGEYDMTFSIICSPSDADRRTHARDRALIHNEPTIAIRRNIKKGSPVHGLEKSRIAFHTLDGIKIVISRETNVIGALPKPRDNDIVRYRARRSWSIDIAGIPWIIDVTIVRTRTYAQFIAGAQGAGENKVIQEFKKMVQTREFDENDFVELEMELDMRKFLASDGVRDLTIDDFARAIEIIRDSILATIAHAHMHSRMRTQMSASDGAVSIVSPLRNRILHMMSQIIRPRSQTKTRLSLKTLLNNARSMDVMQYARTIFPNIGGYFVTGKADGVRGIIVMDSASRCAILTDSADIAGGNDDCMNDRAQLQYVLDGEVMESDTKEGMLFFVFDCIVIDGRACIDRPFSERIGLIDNDLIESVAKTCEPFATVVAKKYERISSTGHDIKEVIERVMTGAKYKTDGIIFTQPDATYSATMNFKWKPADNMTIDFLCVECPRKLYGRGRYQLPVDGMTYAASSAGRSEYVIYLLFCDCTEDQMRGLCINRLDEWREIAETIPVEVRNKIIHFSSSFDPLAYIFIIREQEVIEWLRSQGIDTSTSLHGRIVEMRPHDSHKWDLVRLRTDRVTGNNIIVANNVYASVIAPFTMNMLWEPERGYFDVDDIRKNLIAGNKYRRFVIGAIMSSTLVLGERAHNRILDIGGGRAQDFVRYAAIGAKFIVNYDSDKYAIVEGVSRVTSLVRDEDIMRSRAAEHIRSLTRNSKQCTGAIARAITGGVSTDISGSVQCYAPTYIGRVADMNHMTIDMFKDDLRRIWCDEHSFDVVFSSFAFHYFCESADTVRSVWSIIELALSEQGIVIITTMDGDAVSKLLDDHEGHWGSVANSETKYEIVRVDHSRIRVSVPFARELREEPLCFVKMLDDVASELGFARISTIDFGAKSLLDLFASYEQSLAHQMDNEDITYTSLFRTYIYARKASHARPRTRTPARARERVAKK